MQPLTQNPYSPERWSNIRVAFQLVDVDAAEDATPTATSEAAISRLEQTHDNIREMNRKLASLENNYFVLDGTFALPNETDNDEAGWWSDDISGSDGVFDTPQVLEFNFTEDQSSIGFTVIFDDKADQYASNFTVQVYDSVNALMGEDIVVDNDKSNYISEMPIDGYRRVIITFNKTAIPCRRVRIAEVIFGIIQTFDETNVTELRILHEISVGMENLPSNEMSITIENLSKRYNMINPAGIYKYLQDGQELDTEIGIGETKDSIERVNTGRYYYTSSKAKDSSMTAQIIANDWFYFLEGKCRIGTTGTWTVNEAVAAVIADSGLPISASIPPAIGSRTINKCIPSKATHREAFRLIAQASMSVCFFNREDKLEFVDLAIGEVVDILDSGNLYEPAEVAVGDRINKVEITVKNEYAETEVIYTATNKEVGEADKIKPVDNPLVASSDVTEWLLAVLQKRINYSLQERGNPARELGDTVKIYDAYSENRNAVIIREEYQFSGTLRANTIAWEGVT